MKTLRFKNKKGRLNDSLVKFYLWFLRDQMAKRGMPDYPFLSSHLISKCMDEGVSAIASWRKRVDIYAHDFVLVPVHLKKESHWCLVILCHMESLQVNSPSALTPRLIILDSFLERRLNVENVVKDYIAFEAELLKKTISITKLRVTTSEKLQRKIPRQGNDYDCGLFLLLYCEKFLLDPSAFAQYLDEKTNRSNVEAEWGTLQPNELRNRYLALLERFAGSKNENNVLLDKENMPIIDGMFRLQGEGLPKSEEFEILGLS